MMRISTGMMSASDVRLRNSDIYKKYSKSTESKKNEAKDKTKEEQVSLGNELLLNKKDNKIVVKSKKNDGEVIKTYDLNSEMGKKLNHYLMKENKQDTSELTNQFNQLNKSIKSMSLVNYL